HVAWWRTAIERYIQTCGNDEAAAVRAMTGDCIASIPKFVFEALPPRDKTLAVTLLLPLATDAETQVRAAACRAMGVLVLFPSLAEDPFFVSDMAASVLEQMQDPSIFIRTRASWALANLCDAIVTESEKDEFDFREYMSVNTWERILSAASAAGLDNDKLRSNAVRALGSLLHVSPEDNLLMPRHLRLIKQAMLALMKNIETGSLKTRWNACHAASSMLKNPSFPIGQAQFPWTAGLYAALIQSLLHCRNYKVRIHACMALATPTSLDKYGDQYPAVQKAIASAQQACSEEQEGEYQEYRYKEQLEAQASSVKKKRKGRRDKKRLISVSIFPF
ncbi:armadillo-type protein, partial [Syncephalastrum racemosum]